MTDNVEIFSTGDKVIIDSEDVSVDGEVVLASSDGVSLMLQFEAILHSHVGMMPVLRQTDGTYRSLFGHHVTLRSKAQ